MEICHGWFAQSGEDLDGAVYEILEPEQAGGRFRQAGWIVGAVLSGLTRSLSKDKKPVQRPQEE